MRRRRNHHSGMIEPRARTGKISYYSCDRAQTGRTLGKCSKPNIRPSRSRLGVQGGADFPAHCPGGRAGGIPRVDVATVPTRPTTRRDRRTVDGRPIFPREVATHFQQLRKNNKQISSRQGCMLRLGLGGNHRVRSTKRRQSGMLEKRTTTWSIRNGRQGCQGPSRVLRRHFDPTTFLLARALGWRHLEKSGPQKKDMQVQSGGRSPKKNHARRTRHG